MNFGRLLLVSSSHLLKRAIAAPASVENSFMEEVLYNHRWLASRPLLLHRRRLAYKADLLGPSDGSSDSAQKKEAAKAQRKKRKMFEELVENRRATRVKKTLNALRRREKEYGVSITQADPDFDNMDLKSKNWPAYQVLLECYCERDDYAGFT